MTEESLYNIFNGGWSYTNLEMTFLFKNIDLNNCDNYNILEFGGGDSSIKIHNLFKNVNKLNYFIFETNTAYLPNEIDLFNVNVYDENNVQNINIKDYIKDDIKFDLILIDGPNGENRKYWFNKIKNVVKIDSIILVDDFNHYSSFGEELDKNYDYDILSYSNIPFKEYGEHSWKIVKVKHIKN
jgi:hypothetical protein